MIDDGSDRAHLMQELEDHIKLLPKVRLHRQPKRNVLAPHGRHVVSSDVAMPSLPDTKRWPSAHAARFLWHTVLLTFLYWPTHICTIYC